VRDIASADRAYLRALQRNHRQRFTVERDELDPVAAIPVQQHDGTNVAAAEPMLRQVDSQDTLSNSRIIVLFTDRASGLRPPDVINGPSIACRFLNR